MLLLLLLLPWPLLLLLLLYFLFTQLLALITKCRNIQTIGFTPSLFLRSYHIIWWIFRCDLYTFCWSLSQIFFSHRTFSCSNEIILNTWGKILYQFACSVPDRQQWITPTKRIDILLLFNTKKTFYKVNLWKAFYQ